MPWKLIERPKTERVTPELAKLFADMEPVPRDRPLSKRRLDIYRKLFADGSFRPCTWATASCIETGGIYRVNGKHTSTLLHEMGDNLPEFYVVIERYQTDSLDDVARLYTTFDSRMQSRTHVDINLSFAGTISELDEVGRETINLAVSGLAMGHWGLDDLYKYQPTERAELLLDYTEFVLWLENLLCGALIPDPVNHKRAYHMRRQAVVAAMFQTWKRNKNDSSKFWSLVRDETGQTPYCPDRKLAKYLTLDLTRKGVSNATKSRTDHNRASSRVSNREIFAKCIHAWNAWRKGEKTNLNYYPDAKTPKAF